ncbi:type II secretion system F family protein [Massilia sp. TSP1-1-2]|uniref:type II secretion system F family protein n=2 Tax=unclassified Massilia TaxID=2609279 RepID=UPI003CF6E8C0
MMDAVFYGFSVLLFAAVILLFEGAYLWWSGTHGGGARRITRRLRLMSGGIDDPREQVSILKQRRYSRGEWLDALLQRMRLAHAIDRALLQSGLRWSVAQFIGATLGGLLLALVVLQLRPAPLLAKVVLSVLFMSVPYILLRRARSARLIKIEEQLPEAADFLARAMRAGHSFTNVLQMVGTELPEPLSGEFRAAHEEVNYGVPMNEALYNLADRIPLTDMRYLVIAVVIQRESGGNLAEILGNISHIIRERLKLIGKVRVLSAEGRMSAWVLGLMPFCMMLFMMIANPKYVSVLWTDPMGIKMLWWGAAMILIGVLWIRRLIHIRV